MKHVIRPVPLSAAFVVLGAAILLAVSGHAAWWVVPAGVIGPDLSFLAALGAPEPAHGLLPIQAVRPSNIVHHPAGPMAAVAVSLLLGNPTAAAFSLAWGSHVLWDRGVGYNLRNADGSIKNGERRADAEFARGSR